MSNVQLNPPSRRECVICGRRDRWDLSEGEWMIVVEDGEKLGGNRFCLHEWDITGTHKPIKE